MVGLGARGETAQRGSVSRYVAANGLFLVNCTASSCYVILSKGAPEAAATVSVTARVYLRAAALMVATVTLVNASPALLALVCADCGPRGAWHVPTRALWALAYWVVGQSCVAYCASPSPPVARASAGERATRAQASSPGPRGPRRRRSSAPLRSSSRCVGPRGALLCTRPRRSSPRRSRASSSSPRRTRTATRRTTTTRASRRRAGPLWARSSSSSDSSSSCGRRRPKGPPGSSSSRSSPTGPSSPRTTGNS